MESTRKPAEHWLLTTPEVAEQVARASACAGEIAAADCAIELEQRLRGNHDCDNPNEELAFDSPLEAMFWIWWIACSHGFERTILTLQHHHKIQCPEGPFVVDFAIWPKRAEYRELWTPFGIELDGHTFHERTRDQVQRRDSRDRALQRFGWRLSHYSYAEFMADPELVMFDVIDTAKQAYWNLIASKSRQSGAGA